jgi:transposase
MTHPYQELRELCASNPDAIISYIKQLEARVAELEARINQNSHNSNQPPSSDRFNRVRSLRKKGERHTGGQEGHKGSTLNQTEKPDIVKNHEPKTCDHCGNSLKEMPECGANKRQVFGLRIERYVIEHRSIHKRCLICGKVTKGSFPDDVTQPVQYDRMVLSIASCFQTYGIIPYEPLSELFRDVFGIPISPATLIRANELVGASLSAYERAVKEQLLDSPVINCDETGFNVEAKNFWLHVASTNNLTMYYAHPRRGADATKDMGILPFYRGVAVHDCYRSYYQFNDCNHAICIAHLLRELNGILENTGQNWAQDMIDFFDTLYLRIEEDRPFSNGLGPLVSGIFEQEFIRICDEGLNANPPPFTNSGKKKRGRIPQSKAKNLIDRLIRYRKDILRCSVDFSVPFTNNQAERDLRMMKVYQNRSGGFRSEAGAKTFCRNRGYISTVKKNGLSPVKAIFDALNGSPFIPQRCNA